MARIRTLKPEFFTSSDIVALSPLARLLYAGLWCEADREGRMKWSPEAFKMRYLPTDRCNVAALCSELTERGLVVLYGDGLAFIPSFKDHQNLNPRESESRLPEPPAEIKKSRVSDASGRVSDAPSLPTPSLPTPSLPTPSLPTRASCARGLPFDSDVFAEAWERWVRYRKQAKKPLTEETVRQHFADLAQMTEADAIESIRQSIASSWQGLFPPKRQATQQVVSIDPQRRNAAAEMMARQRAERAAEAAKETA